LAETSKGTKPTEDIRVGDLVEVRNAKTGATALKPVAKLFRRHNRQIFDVKLTAPDGHTEVIGATAEHPFHVRSLGWVAAGKLVPGEIVDQLEGAGDRAVSVEPEKSLQGTYNFEVADAHSYFVGNSHAWVHNPKSGGCQSVKRGRIAQYQVHSHVPAFPFTRRVINRRLSLMPPRRPRFSTPGLALSGWNRTWRRR
jgi:hypothetical protein